MIDVHALPRALRRSTALMLALVASLVVVLVAIVGTAPGVASPLGGASPGTSSPEPTAAVSAAPTPSPDDAVEEPPALEPSVQDLVVEDLQPEDVAPDAVNPEGSAAATDGLVAPMSIPVPAAGQAVLSVRVSGDRIGGNAISATGVAGVTLRLSSSSSSSTSWAAYPWATCVSDADGDCNFLIPLKTSGTTDAAAMRSNADPYVHQVSAPSGYSLISQLRTGSGNGTSGEDLRSLVYQFDATMTAGSTYRSTTSTSFMITSTSQTDQATSAGYWPVRRANPPALQQCGLDVAVLFDLSASIGTQLPTAKRAVDQFTDAFVGTPSRMAVFSFDLRSPASGGANRPNLLPVRTVAQAATFKNQYASWRIGSGTNWDAGLWQVAQAQTAADNRQYDMLVVLTDGNPTSFGTGASPSQNGDNRLRDIEAGIFSANLVKSNGTRIVAVGVGAGAGGNSDRNLMAISGTQQGTDYFQAGNYAAAARYLAALAKGNCEGSIDVVKRVIPSTATVPANATPAQLDAISQPASGWTINATSANPAQVSIGTPAGPWTTNAQGTATVPLKFPTPTAVGPITWTETMRSGYTHQPVTVGGVVQNAVCVNSNTDANVAITNVGTGTDNPGASLPVAVSTAIECTIYNRVVPPPAALATTKTITQVNGVAATTATVLRPGDVVRYQVRVANSGGVAGTTVLTETVPTGTRYTGTGEGWTCAATPAVAGTTCTRSVTVGAAVGTTPTTVTTPFTVTLDSPLADSVTQIRNVVTTSVGTCTSCTVTNSVVPPAALATTKVLTTVHGQAVWPGFATGAGDVLGYTITTQNTGQRPGTTTLTETVPVGTRYTGTGEGWACPTPGVGGSTCTRTITAAPGTSVTSIFTVTVVDPLPLTIDAIRNVVTASTGTCVTCSTVTPVVPVWSITKTAEVGGVPLSSGATVTPGTTITYRVSASNPSAVAATGVVLLDDLSDVLDDATFVTGSATLQIGTAAPSPVAGPSGPTATPPHLLTTSAFTLPAWTTAVLSYRVTVAPEAWGAELRNVVTGRGDVPPQTCPADAGTTLRAPGDPAPECTTLQVTPFPLHVLKVGENATGAVAPMADSGWALWTAATGGTAVVAQLPPVLDGAGAPVTGLFTAGGLTAGTYWLEETTGPAGFQLLAQRVQVVVAADGVVTLGPSGVSANTTLVRDASGTVTIRVEDVPTMDLPDAGGPGTVPFHLTGAALLLVGVALAALRRRRPDRSAT